MSKAQALVMALTAISCLVGCARGPGPVVKRFYESLSEPLKGLDTSSLRGKTIVIDAGHGGVFRGARGPAGLDEANVNLGVAYELAHLLNESGAAVTLTRTSDNDFVGGDSLRLRDDLKARVAIANTVDPDLFISLHHNADLRFDPAFNEVQVYYKLQDRGPSLDAARAVASHLLQNLGEDKGRVIGGNYYVLRNCVAPAVLCEPSFITNPEIESRIRLAEKQTLEAQTYFLGIVDYFSKGVPRVAAVRVSGINAREGGTGRPVVEEARPLIEVDFGPGAPIDGGSVDLRLDGVRLDVVRGRPGTFLAFPESPLRSGTRSIAAQARSTGGNACREVLREFEVSLEPRTIVTRVDPPVADGSNPQRVTAVVLDTNGNPVADSTRVRFSWASGEVARATVDGEARVYTGRDLPLEAKKVRAECAGLESSVSVGSTAAAGAPARAPRFLAGFVVGEAGNPVAGATVIAEVAAPGSGPLGEASEPAAITDPDGYFNLAGDDRPSSLAVSKRGFRTQRAPATSGTYPVVEIIPFYRGLRAAGRIAIDAEGGGESAGAVGPTGVTSSRVNLLVAQRLAGLLASVGIETLLTRDADENPTKEDRVRKVEACEPALLVTISHSVAATPHAEVAHYPNSSAGERASKLLAEEIGTASGYDVVIRETADYLVQQSSCPAVKVTFFGPRTVAQDVAWTDAAGVWIRAYAQMCAVARFLGFAEEGTLPVRWEISEQGRPSAGCLLSIDGTLEAVADKSGVCNLRLIEPGPHTARIETMSGLRWAGTFDPSAGTIRVDLTP